MAYRATYRAFSSSCSLALLLLTSGCTDSLPQKPDGPATKRDLKTADLGAVKDGPVKDGPVKDGPVKDGPVKDGPVKDRGAPDVRSDQRVVDARVDARRDGPGRDGPRKDGPGHDAGDAGIDGPLTKQVPCDANNNNPANSTDIVVNVTVTYNPSTGVWSAPAQCAWACDASFCADSGACVASKQVACDANNSNPANSTDTIANVTVSCQGNGTFKPPAPCAWSCDGGYCLDGNVCLSSKTVPCDTNNGNPPNSSDTITNVAVSCQGNGQFSTPPACSWACNANYCKDGNACLSSKTVQCDTNNGNPPNSSDTIANVPVTCKSDGTFTLPAACAWTCNANTCLDGGSCLTSKTVQCDTNNSNPPNSTDIIANVQVACQSNGTFKPPAPCNWTCDFGYIKSGSTCIVDPACPGQNPAVDLDGNGVSDCAENLLKNSQFPSDVSLWLPQGVNGTALWSSSDANGSASSGSAQVYSNIVSTVATVTGVYQCVPLTGPRALNIYAMTYIPSGQPVTPSAGFGIVGYAAADCTGSTTGVYNSTNWSSPVDAWTLRTHSFAIPAGANSVWIRLNVTKPSNTPPVYIRYDNVLLK